MKKLLVALVFLLALGAVLYFVPLRTDMTATVPDTVADTTTSIGDIREAKEDTSSYTIDIEYQLFGNAAIDAKVESEIQKVVNAFKGDAANFDPEIEMRKYTLSGEVADYFVGADIASERINLYQDMGGAHGLPIVLTLNYDAKSGEEITLDRALTLIGKSLSGVAEDSLAQLQREFGESVFADGASAKAENYQTFIVSPYNVTFIFQAYQVVAYAAGMPEVKFNRKDQ